MLRRQETAHCGEKEPCSLPRQESASGTELPEQVTDDFLLRELLGELRGVPRLSRSASVGAATFVASPRLCLRLVEELRIVEGEVRKRRAQHSAVARKTAAVSAEIDTAKRDAFGFEAEVASVRVEIALAEASCNDETEHEVSATKAAQQARMWLETTLEKQECLHVGAGRAVREFQGELESLGATRHECKEAGEVVSFLLGNSWRETRETESVEAGIQAFKEVISENEIHERSIANEVSAVTLAVTSLVRENAGLEAVARRTTVLALGLEAEVAAEEEAECLVNRRRALGVRELEKEIFDCRREITNAEERGAVVEMQQSSEERSLEQEYEQGISTLVSDGRGLKLEQSEALEKASRLGRELEWHEVDGAAVQKLAAALCSERAAAEELMAAHEEERLALVELGRAQSVGVNTKMRERDAVRCELRTQLQDRLANYVQADVFEALSHEEKQLSAMRATVEQSVSELEFVLLDVEAEATASSEFHAVQTELQLAEVGLSQIVEEAREADRLVNRLAADLKSEKAEDVVLREAMIARHRRLLKVEASLRNAECKELLEMEVEETLREELVRLEDVATGYDTELETLIDWVDGFEAARERRARMEEHELADFRAENIRAAESASSQLLGLDEKLGAELRRHKQENDTLRKSLENIHQLLAGYCGEEAALSLAWDGERELHAQEAAAVVDELGCGRIALRGRCLGV